jgi:hypothetical protein
MTRWRCPECLTISETVDLLRAPSPFNAEDELIACPKCRAVVWFIELCDEPGCDEPASCGFPTADGYRRTCGKHSNSKTK